MCELPTSDSLSFVSNVLLSTILFPEDEEAPAAFAFTDPIIDDAGETETSCPEEIESTSIFSIFNEIFYNKNKEIHSIMDEQMRAVS